MQTAVKILAALLIVPVHAAPTCIGTAHNDAVGVFDPVESFVANLKAGDRRAMRLKPGEERLVGKTKVWFEKGDWEKLAPPAQKPARMESRLRAAWALVKRRELSLDQLGTLLMVWEAKMDYPMDLAKAGRAHRVFGPNPYDAMDPFEALQRYSAGMLVNHTAPLSTATDAEFLRELRGLPKSEQYFWVFDLPLTATGKWKGPREYSVRMTEVNRIANIMESFFVSRAQGRETLMIVPSMGILRAMLRRKYGVNALMPEMRLGVQQAADIFPMLKHNRRVLAFHFPGVNGPKIADGFKAGFYGLTLHDVYHLFAASGFPRAGRKMMLELYPVMLGLERKRQPSLRIRDRSYRVYAGSLKEPREQIIDMGLEAFLRATEKEKIARVFIEVFGHIKVGRGKNAAFLTGQGATLAAIHLAKNEEKFTAILGFPVAELFAEIDHVIPFGGMLGSKNDIPFTEIYRAVKESQ